MAFVASPKPGRFSRAVRHQEASGFFICAIENSTCGMEKSVSRQAHNLEIVGSNPTPTTLETRMDAAAGWITALVGGLSALLGAGVKWLAEKHKEKKASREYDEGIWAQVSAKQEKQIADLVTEMKILRDAHFECEKRFATIQARLEHAEREINSLRQQLEKK